MAEQKQVTLPTFPDMPSVDPVEARDLGLQRATELAVQRGRNILARDAEAVKPKVVTQSTAEQSPAN